MALLRPDLLFKTSNMYAFGATLSISLPLLLQFGVRGLASWSHTRLGDIILAPAGPPSPEIELFFSRVLDGDDKRPRFLFFCAKPARSFPLLFFLHMIFKPFLSSPDQETMRNEIPVVGGAPAPPNMDSPATSHP